MVIELSQMFIVFCSVLVTLTDGNNNLLMQSILRNHFLSTTWSVRADLIRKIDKCEIC